MSFKKGFAVFALMALSGWVGFALGQEKLKISFSNWKPAVVVNKTSALINGNTTGDFSMFWTVWDKVSLLYVDKDKLDPKAMIDGAISGMVAAIGDPYTSYFTVEQNKASKEDLGGSFEGVGIQLGYKDGIMVAMSVLDETPAKKAGVLSGDYILKIIDESNNIDKKTDGMTLPEAVKIIRGKGGTKVKLNIFRQGQKDPFDVELTRGTIVVKSVTVEFLDRCLPKEANCKSDDKFALLKVNRFGDRTQEEWAMAVSEIVNKKPVGIVLDLRNNPGGYLEGAVHLSGEFLSAGKLVVTQRYGDGTKIENKVTRNGALLNNKLVVLVNEGSASASEIMSGALQDHNRAKVVGVKSFGKGSVQQPEDFADGSGLHVTVAKWLRPNGNWIDKIGITPDLEVKAADGVEDTDWTTDVQLVKAELAL